MDMIFIKGMRMMVRFLALTVLIISSACSGHGFPPPSRIACLDDQQQLPIYRVTVSYEIEDDPATAKDESEWLETYAATSVVFEKGYALTAGHSVDGDPWSVTVWIDGSERSADIVGIDPVNDLALLSLDTTGTAPIPFYTNPIILGQQLWTAGYLNNHGMSFSGSLHGLRAGELIVGAPVFQGMSGGPVIVCGPSGPEIAGLIISFNYTHYKTDESQGEGGEKIIEKYYINEGTSNAPGAMMLVWFTEYAIGWYEKNNKREK